MEAYPMPNSNRDYLLNRFTKENQDRMQEDCRKRIMITPKKILWETTKKDAYLVDSKVLLEDRPVQISLQANKPCTMCNDGNIPSLLLDFGFELHGGIILSIWSESSGEGAKLRVRFGESAMETMSELGEGNTATNDHANRDFVTTVRNMSMNPMGETGFRFVRIDLLSPNCKVEIKTIKALFAFKDVPYKGSFYCSDERINQIWNVGAYTVHLNMQEYIWDGIKRDRLVWIGDMHPATLTVQTVFGYDDSVERSLDFIKEETPLPAWMNTFPAYSMWWIIIQHDWFMYNGNLGYLESQKQYFIALHKQLSEMLDENGKDITPEPRFIDWNSVGNVDATDAGLQALHFMATFKLRRLFEVLKEFDLVAECGVDLEKMKQYSVDVGGSKQAAALLVMAGLLDANKTNHELLSQNACAGMSTFMGYYILTARAMAGDINGCLKCIKEYWGGMLQLGATTFWEDFDIDWMENAAKIDELVWDNSDKIDVHGTYGKHCYKGNRHSLCHGWAAGVTPWLTENILGVKVIDAGCKTIKITPQLGDLEWAEGTFPTPYGIIRVKHQKMKDGTIQSQIDAPKEIIIQK